LSKKALSRVPALFDGDEHAQSISAPAAEIKRTIRIKLSLPAGRFWHAGGDIMPNCALLASIL
jgi:hypothetical protein